MKKTTSVFENRVPRKMTAPTRQKATENCIILPFNKYYYGVKLRTM
jgi:hypothetical protein